MKKSTDCVSEVCDAVPVPSNGVIELDFAELAENGINCKLTIDGLALWSNPKYHTNKEFEECGINLVNAAGYNGIESHMMFDAINKAELNIRFIQVLQGKGVTS